MSSVKDEVDLYNIQIEMDAKTEIKLEEIPIEETEKWDLTLKKEIIYWGDYELEINEATDSYIEENFESLVKNTENNLENIYYINDRKSKEYKYIYNQENDMVFKIPKTRIGRYIVHSVEELDYIQKGGTREKEKKYTKVTYDVEFRKVGNISYYEPDLNGLGQESTSLIYYKMEDGKVTSEGYPIECNWWLANGRPNTFQKNGNTYVLYDYENKIWANIRIINGSIETYWTWIPRYAYLNNTSDTNPSTQVEFLQTNSEVPEGYAIAGGFEENNKKGIWISKYEPSYKSQTDSSYYSYYIPDLKGFEKENTYIEVYDKDTGNFDETKEMKVSEVKNLTTFSQNNLWFDYYNGIWANIKVVKNGIETWWTWIPRYAYCNGDTTTDVIFVDINNKPLDGKNLPNSYTIAPAFEGNTKKGIWVSKYEPSVQTVEYRANSEIPDLSGFGKENTYIEIYNKTKDNFEKEVKLSTISDLNEFTKTNLWFDYKDKVWANIRVEKNGIETWWTWIPRYAYCNGGNTTDILLITTDNKLLNGDEIPSSYAIAPAFEGNTKKGIWISKYEPSLQE